MPKFKTGDWVINPQFQSFYKVTGVFQEKYTLTQYGYDTKLHKDVEIKKIATPIDLADFALELMDREPIFYNQIWEKLNV